MSLGQTTLQPGQLADAIHQLLKHCLNGFPEALNRVLEETPEQSMPIVIAVIREKFKIEDVFNSIKKVEKPEKAQIFWWQYMIALLGTGQQMLDEPQHKLREKVKYVHRFHDRLLEILSDLFSREVKDPFIKYWNTEKELSNRRVPGPDGIRQVFIILLKRDAWKIADENNRENVIRLLAYFYIFDTFPERPDKKVEAILAQKPFAQITPYSGLYQFVDQFVALKQQIEKEQKEKEQEEELLRKRVEMIHLGPSATGTAAARLPEDQAKELQEEKEEKKRELARTSL